MKKSPICDEMETARWAYQERKKKDKLGGRERRASITRKKTYRGCNIPTPSMAI